MEPAIRFRWIIFYQYRRQSQRRGSLNNKLGYEPALLPSPLGDRGEIGTHSYTHLSIHRPRRSLRTSGDTPAGSTTSPLPVRRRPLPASRWACGSPGSNPDPLGRTRLSAGSRRGRRRRSHRQHLCHRGDGRTITITSSRPGPAAPMMADLLDIPAGTTLTFSIPAENTNFLQTATTIDPVLSATGNPFTYDYEFGQSAAVESQQLGIPIEGAAIPGANETFATDQNILPISNRSPRPRQRRDTLVFSPVVGPASVQATRARSAT